MKIQNNRLPLLIAVFIAGFSFLTAEVAWSRSMSFLLGTTVAASSLVLSAFMAGFGAGSYFFGKKADSSTNKYRLLAFSAFTAGLAGILNIIFFKYIETLFFNFNLSLSTNNLLTHISAFGALSIFSFFAGGVLPIIAKIVIKNFEETSSQTARIYAIETIGSAMGGVFTGYVFLGNLGQNISLYIAPFLYGIAALYFVFKNESVQTETGDISKNKEKTKKGLASSLSQKESLISAMVFGFVIMALQAVWIRIFKTYFTNTSYTFALITSFSIVGISAGSFIFLKYKKRIRDDKKYIIRLLIIETFLIFFGLILLYKLPEILLFPFGDEAANPYLRLFVLPSIASLLVVFPPAVVSGFAFPLIAGALTNNNENVGTGIGKLFFFNTLGSVVGPLIAVFLLIPIFGSGKTILILSLFFLITGIYLIQKSEEKIPISKIFFASSASLILLVTIFSEKLQFLPPSVKKYELEIKEYHETSEASVIVVKDKKKKLFGSSTFVNNSAVIGSSYDAVKVVKMVGHIPFFAGLKAEKVLIIGFGIGITTSAISSHAEVKHIDCVELASPLLHTAANYSELNAAVYLDSRFHFHKGDGRRFLRATREKYDLISCDPTHPVLGSGNLYTLDYFLECHQHLNPGGMVSQYLPLHKLHREDLLGIIKSFHAVFPNSSMWLGQFHAILVGKKGEGKIDYEQWSQNVLKQAKDMYFYQDPAHLAANVVLDSEKIQQLTKNSDLNTDDLCYTEFFSIDCFRSENIYENLRFLNENRCHPQSIFSNFEVNEKNTNYLEGNIKLNESLWYSLQGKTIEARQKLSEAIAANPEDEEFRFLMKYNYGKK